MKTLIYFLLAALWMSCGPSPLPESYRIKLPASPALRAELLGDCRWRLEWDDSGGRLCHTEIAAANGSGGINILAEWPSAILAWPYWPEKGLAAGLFYPAGAIFPFDLSGDTIILSWEAGVEAYFYRELDKARSLNTTNRIPEFFDWKRFRTLLKGDAPEEIRSDPWLADWKSIAERTVNSGFRSSYIRAETRTETAVIIPHSGPWLGASPFITPEFWGEGEEIFLLLSPRPKIFICPGGLFNVSAQTWLWTAFSTYNGP